MSGAAYLRREPGLVGPEPSPLTAEELEQERNAPAPFPKADINAMSPQAREALRLRSRSIPLVVSHAPLDIVFEDETFLVVSKPSWLKMHPIHRFQGECSRDRTLAYLSVHALFCACVHASLYASVRAFGAVRRPMRNSGTLKSITRA